jgi:uncharacterized protein (UPF0332 family)
MNFPWHDFLVSPISGECRHASTFRSAAACIVDRTGKAAKTHHGVRTDFNRLAKDEERIADESRRVLTQAWNLKAVADDDMGPDSIVPNEHAAAAVAGSARFVVCIAAEAAP